MSMTGTSQVKAKNGIPIWVLTTFFSPYKTSENWNQCRSFISKKLAKEAMKREARRLYKESEIIQGSNDKYFKVSSMEIHFGESPKESDYRKEFGYCKVDFTKLEGIESEWVLTAFFSPYKSYENLIKHRSFFSKELAQEAMKRKAQCLYNESEIIQEAEDKYYEESSMEIHFGENPDGSDYKREFGYCKIEFTKLEDKMIEE